MKVRNPLASLGVTMLGALSLTILASVPVLFIPFWELGLFYLALAAFFVGAFAGRSSLLGSLGFAGATVGGFAGVSLFLVLFQPAGWPSGWEYLFGLGLGGLCGLGGMATGKLGLRRVEKMVESMPRIRRCMRCGAKVGITARKCWSCKGYLPPT